MLQLEKKSNQIIPTLTVYLTNAFHEKIKLLPIARLTYFLYLADMFAVITISWWQTLWLEIAIPGSQIPAVFANPESRDWQHLNPGISGLQKLAKIVLFHVLNVRNKNINRLVNKIFYER